MESRKDDINQPTLTAQAVLDEPGAPVIVFDHVELAFDENVVLRDVSFTLLKGHTKIILGASGAGKSISLKILLGLLKPDSGEVWVNGQRVDQLTELEMMAVRADLGMVFQEGALFDSLTVGQNVGYRLIEDGRLEEEEIEARVREMLGFVGLATHYEKMPSDLSGGQRRRVAIARALTSRPRILLYDEPTTGLDPITALTIDAEIVKLRDLEHVSSIIVTHQLRDAFYVATHQAVRTNGHVQFEPARPDQTARTVFLMLKNGKIAFEGPVDDLRHSTDEYLQAFLS